MNILVCGADGFIGRALCDALVRGGHRVRKGVRHARHDDEVEIDYTADLDPSVWLPRLRDIDVVINAVGILLERGDQTFDRIHRRAPVALFEAAVTAGVRHIVQISALGAHGGETAYFTSKRAADTYLLSLPVAHHVLRPALVYGPHGSSARFFRCIASLPVHPLPAGGHQLLRPIHLDELAEIVVRLVDGSVTDQPVLDLVGGTQLAYRQMLATYRASMGLTPTGSIGIPAAAIGLSAALLDRVPHSMLTRDTWRMLQSGSTAPAATTARLLGREPAGIETFITPADALPLRHEALAAWRPAVLRGALAITWIWTALCSAFIYPRADSLALLAHVHLHGGVAIGALYLASALDLAFGVATLVRPGRRLWAMQAALIAAYSLAIAITMPEFLWHPFGPLLKNLPILALLLILFSEETQP
ncbi:SDR family oxidoreductase [Paraburkholderia sp. BL21I4N1]|uniref:SDR family oxidoreductase n=1 Tax=Paraburkholderia sp. BL21I4N1 TaxID=1938801 RepID=UPI000CFD0347|nr:SDR family oxidoreductase [Paraburkholderia sp. BL21I4N1]